MKLATAIAFALLTARYSGAEVAANDNGDTFDITALGTSSDAETPVWFEIANNRDGSPSGFQMQLVGKDAKAYRAINRKFQNKRFETLSKNRKLKLTAEESEEETLDLLTACVLGFRSRVYTRVDGERVAVEPETFKNTVNIGTGEDLTYSHPTVRRILKLVPEVREQVEDFLQDRTNFVKESPTA